MSLPPEVVSFCRKFARDMAEGTVAIFAGAGMSADAGFVDWKTLLAPFAQELGLSIDRESDNLVRFAQFSLNHKLGNRAHLNEALITAFPGLAAPSKNHEILARLPIRTYWTTNYDRLIESALIDARKTPDVKHIDSQLPVTKPKRDAVVYKMHGDVDHPQEAVLTRDDYESYGQKHLGFVNALVGDLTGKTFLFIGFSFSDPNLDHVLSQLRLRYQTGQREHYCFVRIPHRDNFESDADFAYAQARHRHMVTDLKRYNVTALEIDEYAQITEALMTIESFYRRRLVFVSGSASDFAPWGEVAVNSFFRDLGSILADNDFQIVSGFGLGVGNSLISGAIEKAYAKKNTRLDNFLQVRPFPRDIADANERAAIWHRYRQELLSLPGIALFFLGNKEVDGAIVPADGVRKEFDIARAQGVATVPVGATGSISHDLAAEMLQDPSSMSPALLGAVTALNQPVDDLNQLLQPTIDAVKALAAE
ncbi:SIR2 family protein [Devosia sp. FJ2-5-3]|uniref:SIR2 family protein n=1 Tax=Devosia sp. FJ2-5-3 TaxID=2976680 RepID=UPI0023D7DC2F|nr:SIR2 family protein [Devosia sp. FJ2-5-3]WEJ56763.1 SIR2 family protein [Devosia sp. FJ2-5-3]